ncbi:MAG: zf-HC2 domain-containing protein [Myxococcales bacterium]|nr:zf-HC2 domain-containing protein [Myxococcales bacterium]
MRCREVRPRLVHLQDGEVTPSQRVMLVEHLHGCSTCRDLHDRLEQTLPPAELVIPPHLQRQLEERVAVGPVLERARHVPAPPTFGARLRRMLARDVQVPAYTLVGFAAVVLMAVGASAAGWIVSGQLQSERNSLAERAAVAPVPPVAVYDTDRDEFIDADRWVPASFEPTDTAEVQ